MKIVLDHIDLGFFARLWNNLPKVGNFIVSAVADEFGNYVRVRKLSGQVLKSLTPGAAGARGSTRFFKMKTGEFGVRPGSRIRGRLNYLIGFESGFRAGHLKGIRRPFMQPAAREFEQSGKVAEIGNRIISAMIVKGGYGA